MTKTRLCKNPGILLFPTLWNPAVIMVLAALAVLAASGYAAPPERKYAENEILARSNVKITVGIENADIVGRDNRALQAAVDYVAMLGGGTVEIGPGVYLMRDSLHMRSRVTVRGAGPETILKKDASVMSLLAADGDFGEEAVTVRNPEGFEIGRGVYIASKKVSGFHSTCATILNRRGNYFTISRPLNADSMVRDAVFAATVYPVVSAYHVQDFRIENLTVDGNRARNETAINGCRGAGIFFYRGDGAVIENCIVRDYNGDGISFQQSNDVQVLGCVSQRNIGGIHPGSGSQRPVVRGCRSLDNDRDGFYFCWRVRNAIVEGNEFRGNKRHGVSIGHKDSDNLLRGNTIAENERGGVYWRNESAPMAAHRNRLIENTIEDNGRFGIYVDGHTDDTLLRSNIIRDTGSGKQKTGIRIGKNAGLVAVENNKITAAQKIVDERTKRQ